MASFARHGCPWRRKRIQELVIRREPHFLVQVDTVVRYIAGTKRYIFTAIDQVTKLAYARMYPSGSSQSAADFLQRLWILFGARIRNLQTDNGSEFAGAFTEACREFGVERYFSRVKTPKDNAAEECFNETLDVEFLRDGTLDSNVQRFKAKLAPWLVEYNSVRPHATLSYLTPSGVPPNGIAWEGCGHPPQKLANNSDSEYKPLGSLRWFAC